MLAHLQFPVSTYPDWLSSIVQMSGEVIRLLVTIVEPFERPLISHYHELITSDVVTHFSYALLDGQTLGSVVEYVFLYLPRFLLE